MRKGSVEGEKARVADIVAEAGLSNEAFYKHFRSKDALVEALLDDGAQRLYGYLAHQMAKESTPEGKVKRWVVGVLGQAAPEPAAATLAVLFNAGSTSTGRAAGRHPASEQLATLLHEPFQKLGSSAPTFAATFAAHAVLGKLSDFLWSGARTNTHVNKRLTGLCLAVAMSKA